MTYLGHGNRDTIGYEFQKTINKMYKKYVRIVETLRKFSKHFKEITKS